MFPIRLFVDLTVSIILFSLHRRVLQLSDLSRRLETIQEQVLPFAPVQDQDNTQEVMYKDDLAAPATNNNNNNAETGGENAASTPTHGQQQRAKGLKSTQQSNNILSQNSAPVPHQSSVWNMNPSQTSGGSNGKPEYVPPHDRLAQFYLQYNKVLLDNIAIAREKERLARENAQLQDLIGQYVAGTTLNNDVLRQDNPLFVVNGRYANVFFFVSECLLVLLIAYVR